MYSTVNDVFVNIATSGEQTRTSAEVSTVQMKWTWHQAK